MNNACLYINSLDLFVNLGWPQNEREEKQTVRLDIEFHFPEPPAACTTDNLQDTFCYSDLITQIIKFTADKNFHLIEHLAQEIHTLIIKTLKNNLKIIVHVTKHPTIRGFTGNVRFTYGS